MFRKTAGRRGIEQEKVLVLTPILAFDRASRSDSRNVSFDFTTGFDYSWDRDHELEIELERGVDIGVEHKGRKVGAAVTGGAVGVILDARDDPIQIPTRLPGESVSRGGSASEFGLERSMDWG